MFSWVFLTLLYISHEWADAEGEQFDLRGSMIYGVMLFCGIFGLFLLPDPSGIASGMVATMRSLGQVLSMAIVMFCFSIFIGTVMITPQFTRRS
jgi:hypothetical protein